MQHRKQPAWARLQLLTRLALNAGKHTANQPARLAQFDDGNDRAILVQGDEGPAQVVRLGHRGTPSVRLQRRSCHVLAARPIESSSSWIRSSIFIPPRRHSSFSASSRNASGTEREAPNATEAQPIVRCSDKVSAIFAKPAGPALGLGLSNRVFREDLVGPLERRSRGSARDLSAPTIAASPTVS